MNDSTNNISPIILFATPHKLDELLAIKVNMAGASNAGKMQPQVVKCREFIFTEPDVIGTPSPDITDHSFNLVTKIDLMKSGKLQNRLSRIGLQPTKPYPVSTELYQACLRYTIQARLSPSWNKAGQWLIQGRDFLTHKGSANAVKLDVNYFHNELFFTLEATVMKLTPMHVTDLDITPRLLECFTSRKCSLIDHDHILSDWCYVLPSMKRGRIVTISHDLPEESPFRTYRDLKRHWKNTYGYRLPENEDDVSFYQVHFGPLGGRLFTYPGVCLRGRDLHKMHRIDPKPILRTFIQDLQAKFPTVCGCPIKLQSKAKFTVPGLSSGNQVSADNQPNLTSKLTGARPALYRTKAEMETIYTANPQQTEQKQSSSVPTNTSQKSATDVSRSTTMSAAKPLSTPLTEQQRNVNSSKPFNNKLPSETPLRAGQPSATPGMADQNNDQTAVARKLFPNFQSAKRQVPTATPTSTPNNSAPKIVPLFHAKSKVAVRESMQKKPTPTSQSVSVPHDLQSKFPISSITPSINLIAPSFQKAKVKSVQPAKGAIQPKKAGSSKQTSKQASKPAKSKKRLSEKSMDGMGDFIVESKKIKKMRKAEA